MRMKDIQSAKWLLDPTKLKAQLESEDLQEGLQALAQIQISCANFASIILDRNDVNVKYNTHTETGSTDGDSINIRVPLAYELIDATVALVAHEASHIKYSDFEIYKGAEKGFVNSNFHKAIAFHGIDPFLEMTEGELKEVKDILNIVEDARIDMLTMRELPGLTPYYAALYDENRNTVEQTADFNKKQPETRDSYIWAICNYSNPNRKMDVLDRFQDVVNIIDYPTLINKTTEEVVGITCDVWKEIRDLKKESDVKLSRVVHNPFSKEGEESDSDVSGQTVSNPVTPQAQKQINDIAEQIKDAVENNMKSTQGTIFDDRGNFCWKGFDSSIFYGSGLKRNFVNNRQTAVYSGVQLGKMLAKQLQFRNMDFGLHVPNIRNGKLNPNKLATVAAGNDKPFYKIEETDYNNFRFVFSIDASGSMVGSRMDNALKTTVALATALETTPGIEIEVHLRGGYDKGNVATLYNSKNDSIYKLYDNCYKVAPAGGTPDGNCFIGMHNYLKNTFDGSKENYFISLSDGGPNSTSEAIEGINNIEGIGYDIMGFFIGYVAPDDGFFNVYGEDAAKMQVENLPMIAKYLMNKIIK